jgi:uncharacterized protein YndB with AHSA1/START domain
MGQEEARPIELSIWIAARPETVFAFLTDPAKLVQWLGLAATLEARPEGLFRVDVNGRDFVRGRYVEVKPPERVVFTWGWEDGGDRVPPGATTVEITLTPELGGTIVRLVHSGLPDRDRDAHAWGWGHYAARLKMRAEGRDPGFDSLARPEIVHG